MQGLRAQMEREIELPNFDSEPLQRLEQEMVMLAQKSDVAEELDRLSTHIIEVRRVLKSGGAAGRRRDRRAELFPAAAHAGTADARRCHRAAAPSAARPRPCPADRR